jgi:hypothetical protein
MEVLRTQVYLRRDQHAGLKEEGRRLGVSATEILRRAVDAFLGRSSSAEGGRPRGFAAVTSLGRGRVRDGSLRHDRYVAEAIGERLHG